MNQSIIDKRNRIGDHSTSEKAKVIKVISREKESINIVEDAEEARKKRRVQRMLGKKGALFASAPIRDMP